MMTPAAARRLSAAAVSVRLALAALGSLAALGKRIEIATSLTSVFRVKEALHLLHLGMSPYAGSAFHAPPLLLPLWAPFMSGPAWLPVVPAVIFDVVSAWLLFLIARTVSGGAPRPGKQSKAEARKGAGSNVWGGDGWPFLVAALYLLNPLSILACVGGSTGGFDNAAALLAIYGGTAGRPAMAALGVVLAAYLSLHPVFLAVPVVMMLVAGVEHCPPPGAAPPAAAARVARMGGGARAAIAAAAWAAAWGGALWWLSGDMMARAGGGGGEAWPQEVYGYILTGGLAGGLFVPNLGLWWYFFTEMFKEFHSLFVWAFHIQSVLMLPALARRMPHRPLFVACCQCMATAAFKPHPSVADVALSLGLLPVFATQLGGMSNKFIVANVALYVAVLAPVLLHLWLESGSGNANFFYAITLVWGLAQIFLLVEVVSSTIAFDRDVKMKGKGEEGEGGGGVGSRGEGIYKGRGGDGAEVCPGAG